MSRFLEIDKEAFYAKLEQKFDSCPQRDVKIVIGDMDARIGREEMYKPVIGPNSLHTVTNDNGQRCINFAASYAFHLECLQFNPPEGRFICGEFESGRMHLNDESQRSRT
ncbi:hypothetical protein pipiens_011328 [Culex pipiens pipiens]|uniref:Uncharacterized protein n=2 Tax=Culex pipiens pipiens TaxID=38569 RepID=A0ABD1D6R7_CULPP